MDADALPVAPPAGRRLVEAARPGDPVAGPVLDDAGLLVEEGAVGRRPAARVAGHGDLHVEMAAGDHPREQLQGVGRRRAGRGEGQVGEAPLDPFAKRFAALDGFDLGRTERAADDEAHPPAVSHQALDPAGREGEGAGVEVPGQPVVALRVFERGDVEEPDEVAVLGGVFEPPGMVGEHERLPCPGRRRGPGASGGAAERRLSRAARRGRRRARATARGRPLRSAPPS